MSRATDRAPAGGAARLPGGRFQLSLGGGWVWSVRVWILATAGLGFEALRAFPVASARLRQPLRGTSQPLSNHTNHHRKETLMNSITLTGRLTQDPEQRALPSGSTVCRLRLAVDGMGRGGRDEVGYINVSAFGNAGDAAARVLTKGWLVAVDGRLQYGEWETDDGTRRHDYEIVGNVEFLAAPRGENDDHPVATGAGEAVAL